MAHVPAGQRRQQLIEAAFKAVAKEGVAAATTRRIAAEAEVPAAVVHYCFRSRRELLAEMMSAVFSEAEQAVQGVLRPSGGAEESLRAAFDRLWEGYRADPERHQAVFDLTFDALRQPETLEILRRHQARIDGLAQSFLNELAEKTGAGWDRPVPMLSRLLISTVDGVLMGWLIDRDDARARAALSALASHIASHASKDAPRD